MKIVVVGTRGIPDIQGGVETHCDQIYPRLAAAGCDVTVVTRTPYVAPEERHDSYRGVHLKHIYAPRKKSLEAIVHTTLAVLYARLADADIVHIHAIGPALLTPFARALGLRTVVTHHGPDYDRQKWGRAAKWILRKGEFAGARFSNRIIVISQVIAGILERKYGRRDSILIYNGVPLPEPATGHEFLDRMGLEPGKYVIGVGRFVEEKGFHDLIAAWKRIDTGEMKLVLVGDADHETTYSRKLKSSARENGVFLTGFIKGEPLREIFSHARLFTMPSYHEGLPIALLEAMSYNRPVLVSNIPANLEVPLDKEDFFPTGNVEELANSLKRMLSRDARPDYTELLHTRYNWDTIAEETRAVYLGLLQASGRDKKASS